MFVIDHEYLSQLENPHEAITEDLWRDWRSTILNNSVSSQPYSDLLDMDIKDIATNCGILWKMESSETISELLQKDFHEIKDRKHISTWIKKAIVLTFAKVLATDAEGVTKIITLPPTEKELAEMALKEDYNEARISIVKYVDNARKEVTDENFETTFRGLVEICLRTFAVLSGVGEERVKRYIPIAFDKFVHNAKIKDMSEKHEAQHGVINNIIQKIGSVFVEDVMVNERQLETFDKKFMHLYEEVYTKLDNTDKDGWAEKLQLMKNFRKYFIGKELEV